MTETDLGGKKPPYVIEKRSGFYWQPRGKVRLISPPCELGTVRIEAYLKGWRLYYDAKSGLKKASSQMRPYSVSWAAEKWRQSRDFCTKADGKPKQPATMNYHHEGLKIIEACIGDKDLRALERRHVKRWREQLQADGKFSNAVKVIKTLRAFYSFCIDEGWYKGQNPASKMKIHLPAKQSYVPWTWPRVLAFYEKAVEIGRPSVGPAVALIYDSAQNPVDVLALEWPQGEDGVMQLYNEGRPVYRPEEGELDMARQKTGVGNLIPLSQWARELLDAIPEEERRGGIVVSEETGERYTRRNFAAWVQKIRKKAGLPEELKAGNLRHEAGQEADDGGASAEEIQSLLQHARIGTQRFYTRRRRAGEAQAAREQARNRALKSLKADSQKV
ncbi:tyrosine-type recombinase/integrase [Pelagibius marinus]|uniref:tyrosine-type recombinase/integrase n=1 Tax=Pelagibius marinus TaxID=2762760 RepID=UPI00187280DE|nr:tyrosine-type recombinase/integrase [Pelagibius marinus]